MLKLKITRTSPTEHRLEYVRANGTGETVGLDTKGFLWHDFAHYCFESEAGLKNSFFGLLDQGYTYAQMSPDYPSKAYEDKEIFLTERLVGPLQKVLEGGVEIDAYLDGVQNMASAYGESLPDWLTRELIVKVKENYRKIKGQWNSLRFGETMQLEFGK